MNADETERKKLDAKAQSRKGNPEQNGFLEVILIFVFLCAFAALRQDVSPLDGY
jgi:hypothetical protein